MKAHPERMLLFRLARELGMTKSRVIAEIDSRELAEWMAYFWIEHDEIEAAKTGKKKVEPKVLADRLKAALGAFRGGKSREPAYRSRGKRGEGKQGLATDR